MVAATVTAAAQPRELTRAAHPRRRTDTDAGDPQARDQGLATGIQMYQRFAPERLDDQHVDVADALVDRAEAHELRTHADL
ncbi:MAG: hypothetical protein AUI86_10835 [Gemmatimonadetes bacterium 13_1_40CM_3_66_12]|nr:MAG: hypothetical protein AUI86_10835 [Gemmatimonadetes bacterium 13_1_40CM_3_66_12]